MRKGLLTTNDLKPAPKVEPRPLNHITTAIIPDAVPRPEPKGDGFAKMISTHDEPPGPTRDVDDMSKDEADVEVGKPIHSPGEAPYRIVEKPRIVMSDGSPVTLPRMKGMPGRKAKA